MKQFRSIIQSVKHADILFLLGGVLIILAFIGYIEFTRQSWKTYSHPRLALRFQHPNVDSQGSLIRVTESEKDDEVHVFFNSEEVNFSVSLYPNTSIYEALDNLETVKNDKSDTTIASEKREISIDGKTAFTFDVNSRGEEGSIILLQKESDLYLIAYKRNVPVNAQILSTLKIE